MSRSSQWEEVARLGLESDEALRSALKKALKELRLDAKELSKLSGVSESSIYKILSGERANPRLSTFREIVRALKKLEPPKEVGEPFIAVVASRPMLDAIGSRYVQFRGHRIRLKEYTANSIEDVIVAAVRAQQEGAKAIVCAPIVSTTLEKVVSVPVSACPIHLCKQPMLKAVEAAVSKVLSE